MASSRSTTLPSPHQIPPAPAMSTNPARSNQTSQTTLTPPQLEARTILTHLLTRLSQPKDDDTATNPRYDEYSAWINQHSIPTLTTSLYSMIRPQLWTLLSSRLSLDALKHVGGDLRLETRGAIYFNGILGVDKRLRMYVGQSGNLRQRVAQHLNFRYRRDHFSLHYYALEWSVYNVFGVCAVFPPAPSSSFSSSSSLVVGMERSDLVMNVLEMWMCLVFRSLPSDTLQEWLPDDELVDKGRKTAKEGVVGGLNVATPLDQGVEVKDMPFVDLSGELDPVIRDYLREVKRRKGDVQQVENVKITDGAVEVDEEERALRKKMYAEKARRYSKRRETDIVIPQWVFLGAVAVGVGVSLFRSSGGPGSSARWR
ncbi:hypothetical protein CC77DRAFT_1026124 [Alternaria alternata]|uniref:GIY-YIG domain-containing protein n=1 Tax=Alternaria alternata TaxID=5599 RepID=A0A177D4J3_ALTAL|nr:hypothetical protein CC77DRAFT_1026124 [Alternaria alternata]OAG14060.1 hypothetical protein CC77DRAFT_1026124 [Alternaria alternata]